jgi:uncharacterized membrane protein SpoIIM required for sporulation
VRLDRFTSERAEAWEELERTLRKARGRPERLGADGVHRLGRLYRAAAADLALARRSFPGDPLVGRLESLVTRSRPVVYSADPRRAPLRQFLTDGYWQLVRQAPLALAVAWALLLVPAALSMVWALDDPGAASGLVPQEYRNIGDSGGKALGGGDEQAEFSSLIFTNNIRVTFLAFAGGALVGLGTVFVVAYNGVLLGTVFGLAVGAGHGAFLVELVSPHGVLELSCIAVCAAAGLQMGWTLVDPGAGRRGAAFARSARTGAEVVLGTMPWLVLAGLVEGFVTPRRIGVPGALAVGFALAAVYWALVLWRGSPARAAPAPSP